MAAEKRVRRTPQQIASDVDCEIDRLRENIRSLEAKRTADEAEFDRRITSIKQRIQRLEEHKQSVLSPKPRRQRRTKAQLITELVGKAQKSGLKISEIADKLGVDLS